MTNDRRPVRHWWEERIEELETEVAKLRGQLEGRVANRELLERFQAEPGDPVGPPGEILWASKRAAELFEAEGVEVDPERAG